MITFRCALCGEEHESDREEEDALAEMERLFGNIPPEERRLICDECFAVIRPDKAPRHRPAFPVDREKALQMLADDDPIEARFELVPNIGVTLFGKLPNARARQILSTWSTIEESGPTAQALDFGIHIHCINPPHGYGRMFFKTKPEARVSREELLEKERGG